MTGKSSSLRARGRGLLNLFTVPALAGTCALAHAKLAPPRTPPGCEQTFLSLKAPVSESLERFLSAHPEVLAFAEAHPAGAAFLTELRARQADAQVPGNIAKHPALNHYIGFGSGALNHHLRSPGPFAFLNLRAGWRARRLDAALTALPDYAGVVFRGIGVPPADLRHDLTTEGRVVRDAGFTSTADAVTTNYRPRDYELNGLYLIIRSRTGKSLRGQGLSWEREVLFRRGTHFRVVMVMPRPRGGHFVFLDEVAGSAYQDPWPSNLP